MDRAPRGRAHRWIATQEPHQRVSVQQQLGSRGVFGGHFIASHSTSMGEIMSPSQSTLPFIEPNRDSCGGIGTNCATGFPCLVITRVSRFSATSSSNLRHLALNSPAAIVVVMAIP